VEPGEKRGGSRKKGKHAHLREDRKIRRERKWVLVPERGQVKGVNKVESKGDVRVGAKLTQTNEHLKLTKRETILRDQVGRENGGKNRIWGKAGREPEHQRGE